MKYIWFVLLVMAWPSHATHINKAEYYGDSGASQSYRYPPLPQSALASNSLSALGETKASQSISALLELTNVISAPIPHHTSVTLNSAYLWASTSRFSRAIEPTFETPLDNKVHEPSCSLYFLPVANNIRVWESRHCLSNHRISGWKETNAMYVALNSQY